MTTNKMNAERVYRLTNYRRYSDCGHNYLGEHAEGQLSGRSHYYDKSTRKYFGCRVNQLFTALDGLLLCTVESVAPPQERRAHRAVVFDITGTVIYRSFDCAEEQPARRGNGYGFRTGAQALKDLERFLKSYLTEEEEAQRILDLEAKNARKTLERLAESEVMPV